MSNREILLWTRDTRDNYLEFWILVRHYMYAAWKSTSTATDRMRCSIMMGTWGEIEVSALRVLVVIVT
jgi:hypothetical protein